MPYVTDSELSEIEEDAFLKDDSTWAVHQYRHLEADTFQGMYGRWARRTFPLADQMSLIKHLRDEVNEEIHPTCADDELADAYLLLLLLHLAHVRGVSLDSLAKSKARVNFGRTWATTPNEAGFFPHVE